MGFDSTPEIVYGDRYWREYQQRDASAMGEALTAARIEFVSRHYAGEIVDIGVGGGRFVREARCRGYDINPLAVEWLDNSGRYQDPFADPIEAATCWDSLEHMPSPETFLRTVTKWLFVSIPVENTLADWLTSPHYKPGEHLWYWSTSGFINWVFDQGFELMELSDFEIRLGRHDIKSFAFKRTADK